MKKLLAIIGLAAASLSGANAQILMSFGTPITVNFNNLNTNFGSTYNSSGGSSTFPTAQTVTNPFTIYSGSTNPALVVTAFNDFDPGGVYSNTGSYSDANSWRALQNGSSNDYSLGLKNSGTARFVLRLQNNTLSALDTWSISYDVEQYSQGASATTFTFDYGLSPTGTWITTGLIGGAAVTATTGAVGSGVNLGTVLSTNRTATISSSIAAGAEIFLRWNYNHGSGTSPHMGIDNIVVSAVPEPTTWALIGIGSAFALWRTRRRTV